MAVRMGRTVLAFGTLPGLFLCATLAHAQTSVVPTVPGASPAAQAGEPPPPGSQDSTTATPPAGTDAAAAPSATGEAGLGDIIVTANRRSENIQRTPLSIAAIGGEQLAARGITDSQSLNGVVPGLKIAYTGSQVQLFIRGVGDVAANSYTQSSVSLNIDGVYVARTSAFGSIFFDTARVEVLRGPQGTLYGRNSSGGAINIISNAPVLDQTSGYVVGELGNYNLARFQGVLNLPVTDTLAIRGAVQVVHRDGYLTDGSNDDKSESVRLRALWKPTSGASFNLTGEFAHVGGKGYGRVYRPVLFGDPYFGPQDPKVTPALFPSLLTRNDNNYDARSINISGQADVDLGGNVSLTVLPAYRYLRSIGNIGTDYPLRETDQSRQKSVETRLSGDGRLKWVVGGYYFREDLGILINIDQRTIATGSGQVQTQSFPQFNTEAVAGFGEGTFSLTDRLRLTGGLRYTTETRSRLGDITTFRYVAGNAPAPTVDHYNQQLKDNAFTYRAGAEFDLRPQSMLFANVSTGFKSGGFDAVDADSYTPEYVTAYTIGLKNRFFDNKLQLNLEGFYWKYRDQQVSFLGVNLAGFTTFVTRNAGQSKIYGLSADAVWRPTSADTLSINAEYLHTKYDFFQYATPGATAAGGQLSDGCYSRGPGATAGTIIEDCSGNPLQRAPEWTVNGQYGHSFDLGSGATLLPNVAVKYQSSNFLQTNYLSPNFRQDGVATIDADLTYTSPNRRWSLQLWVRNLTDKAVYTTASTETSVQPNSGPNRGSIAAIAPPRTFGARARVNF